jgi:hypothetical protein
MIHEEGSTWFPVTKLKFAHQFDVEWSGVELCIGLIICDRRKNLKLLLQNTKIHILLLMMFMRMYN